MKLLAFTTLAGMVGCAGNDARYYEAVAQAAEATAKQTAARYEALSSLAQAGGPATQASAAMAIALTNAPVITPAYIESNAIKWAQVLAAPLTGIAGMHYQYKANQAQVSANRDIQLGQQGMFTNITTANAAGAGASAVGFSQALSDVALAGLNVTSQVASEGLTASVSVAQQGLATVQGTAELGLQGTTGVATAGLDATAGLALDNNDTFIQSLQLRQQELQTIITGFEPTIVDPVIVETPSPVIVNPQIVEQQVYVP